MRALRPVRVCFLIDELATAGTETQLLALIRDLDRSRVRPFLALLRGDSPVSQALEPADCPVLRLGVGSLRDPRTAMKGLSFAMFLRREKIDVVQAYFPDSSYFGVPAAWLAGVPHRVRTRNNVGHWMTPAHRRLGRALNALTTATVANCAAAREALIEDERTRPGSVVVMENGVDLERFPSEERFCEASLTVGCVANLRHVKGIDVLIDAATRLPGVAFEVAGEGEERDALQRRIDAAGMRDRFHLLGSCNDVPNFLARLAVAVLPSRAEGMSNAVLEYMAAARPIVATATGAMPVLIRNGRDGLLVPPSDAESLARAVRRLLEDRALARQLGDSARRRVQERYSRAAMVRRFEDFYTRLVHRPERGIHAASC